MTDEVKVKVLPPIKNNMLQAARQQHQRIGQIDATPIVMWTKDNEKHKQKAFVQEINDLSRYQGGGGSSSSSSTMSMNTENEMVMTDAKDIQKEYEKNPEPCSHCRTTMSYQMAADHKLWCREHEFNMKCCSNECFAKHRKTVHNDD